MSNSEFAMSKQIGEELTWLWKQRPFEFTFGPICDGLNSDYSNWIDNHLIIISKSVHDIN